MAVDPHNPNTPAPQVPATTDSVKERRKRAEDDVFMREVDEAVRADSYERAAKKYGVPIVAALVLGLAAFAGWLWYDRSQEAAMEKDSEVLVRALDQVQDGNLDAGSETLAPLVDEGGEGAAAAARMLQAGILAEEGNTDEAATMFAALAADGSAPQAYRDLATIREVSLRFDSMEPAQVIERLKPLATPGNPWFGSAGELTGMAYIKQDKPDLAGPLFVQMAKDEDVPESLRSRARQMAGLLGADAIEDPEAVVEQVTKAVAPGAARPQAAPPPAEQPAAQ